MAELQNIVKYFLLPLYSEITTNIPLQR